MSDKASFKLPEGIGMAQFCYCAEGSECGTACGRKPQNEDQRKEAPLMAHLCSDYTDIKGDTQANEGQTQN